MSNETPGRDAVPGWGQPVPEPPPDEATVPWPAQPEPAATPWPAEADAPEAPAPPWPSTPEPAPQAPASPAAPGTWGAPPQPAPQPAPTPQQTGWGAPPAQQPPAWGATTPPVPPQQPGAQQQPPGGWGAPPPQGGWAPGGPGAPGGPPVGWAPAPAPSGGNGCLKGCLIVGAIGFVLVILLGIAITVLGLKFAQDLGVDPGTGTLKECSFLSSADASAALGGQADAMPLGGLVDATIGRVLDNRVIPDAEDCWVAGDNTATGRVARQSGGDASGAFRSAKAAATAGGYFAGDVSGIGDEAFCTGMSEAASFGVLVRRGDTLVYVSLIDPATVGSGYQTNADGVVTSPETCALDQAVAKKVLR